MSGCNFYVGQKVVFVPISDPTEYQIMNRRIWLERGLIIPVEGVVYTIRSIGVGMNAVDGDVPVLFLEEIRNANTKLYGRAEPLEPGFSFHNFRPVVERKTDISCFKAMLNPARSAVPA